MKGEKKAVDAGREAEGKEGTVRQARIRSQEEEREGKGKGKGKERE